MQHQARYKVRPFPEKETQTKEVFKILLSPATLLLLGLTPGGICNIRTPQGLAGPAVAWNAFKEIKDDVVQVPKALQELYGLKLESRISITASEETVTGASDIALSEIDHDVSATPRPSLNEDQRLHWAFILGFDVRSSDILSPGLVFAKVGPEKRTFQIQRINASGERVLYRSQADCKIRIVDQDLPNDKPRTIFASNSGLGGLKTQVQQINDLISPYSEISNGQSPLSGFHQPFVHGVLLHGPPGTGKSLALQKIADAGWRRVLYLEPEVLKRARDEGNGADMIRVFTEALQAQPSVIIIDCLDSNHARRDSQDSDRSANLDTLLGKQLDRLSKSRTFVAAAITRLTDLDQNLRLAERFAIQIEIPVPDSSSRAEILKVLGDLPRECSHPVLDNLAARTHAFVGADLKLLYTVALHLHSTRIRGSTSDGKFQECEKTDPALLLDNMNIDFDNALSHVHPSAMQNIFIEAPDVKWTDIAGQQEVKKVLHKALVWPFKHADILKEHSYRPKKGLLLYGPPGCSKTMTAKAAANESGLNFLTVKGAELVSMYVGESERKLRNIFSKARAVRPSIIFFDEIDAIGAATGGRTHEGVHTVTTLLNELDGFQAMADVFVLAATNKPETLDPALIRAGRLDRCVFVGLPDFVTRKEILKLNMRDMKLGNDIDDDGLAENMEGCSGAEIAQMCEQARDAAIEAQIESGERTPVSQKYFESALTKLEKSVTEEMIRQYKAWGASRQQG